MHKKTAKHLKSIKYSVVELQLVFVPVQKLESTTHLNTMTVADYKLQYCTLINIIKYIPHGHLGLLNAVKISRLSSDIFHKKWQQY